MPRTTKLGRRRVARKPAGKKPYRKRLVARSVSDFAGVSETIPAINGQSNLFSCNAAYSARSTTLTQFRRAVAVAQGYQYYRITKLEFKFKPTVDTFAAGGATPQSVPHLYYMVDKGANVPSTFTIDTLKSMGAVPKRLDDKTINISWKPSALQEYYAGGGSGAQNAIKLSPWLSTSATAGAPGVWNPSSVQHMGLVWLAEQLNAGTNPTQYSIEITAHFQFKKPLINVNASAPPATEINTSH